MVATDDRGVVALRLAPGPAGDGPEGRRLLATLHGGVPLARDPATGAILRLPLTGLPLAMDRAYEGDATRQAVRDVGLDPVVPPKCSRRHPWPYDADIYRRRNQVERLFCRLKRFRRIATRYDKLDRSFLAFIHCAFIADWLCEV